MTQTDERRPRGAPNGPGGDITTVPALADSAADFLAGYDCGEAAGELRGEVRGWRDGYAAGRAEEAAERDAVDEATESAYFDATNKALVRVLTSRPSYADLADLRGEPERAARQRAILAANGVTL